MQSQTMESGRANDARQHTDLIASDRVEGTAVYGRDGERLGTISHFMVHKRSGKVEYAALAFGGFLGVGTDEYPLPWNKLEYDSAKGGYVVDLNKEALEGAPRYAAHHRPDYDDDYSRNVSNYYGVG
jgi:sporulation protein YlmC with PRC-barrel domain